MTQLTIDLPLQERFRAARETIELLDDSGRTLGIFCPMLSPPYEVSLIPVLTEEARRERLSQPGKYSTGEILRHLKSL